MPPWEWRQQSKQKGQIKSEKTVKTTFTCGAKRYCKQISNCVETKFI
jgi:hypothetical protein